MAQSELGQTVELAVDFDNAVERVTAALSTEGFGVISRIDLDKAFEQKLGIPFRRYTILGACNPSLAHTAVSTRPEVGLLLPCNVVVEETSSGARVRIVDAAAMLSLAEVDGTSEIAALAADASTRLAKVAVVLNSTP